MELYIIDDSISEDSKIINIKKHQKRVSQTKSSQGRRGKKLMGRFLRDYKVCDVSYSKVNTTILINYLGQTTTNAEIMKQIAKMHKRSMSGKYFSNKNSMKVK